MDLLGIQWLFIGNRKKHGRFHVEPRNHGDFIEGF